ncbi:hypothetical protein K474DRAFT_552315 [Panus rudis PR-1116 ss-1]|nr:hypothetical protein K474DRAFT_552315 [Panus rudis PR-1116 ss-1]
MWAPRVSQGKASYKAGVAVRKLRKSQNQRSWTEKRFLKMHPGAEATRMCFSQSSEHTSISDASHSLTITTQSESTSTRRHNPLKPMCNNETVVNEESVLSTQADQVTVTGGQMDHLQSRKHLESIIWDIENDDNPLPKGSEVSRRSMVQDTRTSQWCKPTGEQPKSELQILPPGKVTDSAAVPLDDRSVTESLQPSDSASQYKPSAIVQHQAASRFFSTTICTPLPNTFAAHDDTAPPVRETYVDEATQIPTAKGDNSVMAEHHGNLSHTAVDEAMSAIILGHGPSSLLCCADSLCEFDRELQSIAGLDMIAPSHIDRSNLASDLACEAEEPLDISLVADFPLVYDVCPTLCFEETTGNIGVLESSDCNYGCTDDYGWIMGSPSCTTHQSCDEDYISYDVAAQRFNNLNEYDTEGYIEEGSGLSQDNEFDDYSEESGIDSHSLLLFDTSPSLLSDLAEAESPSSSPISEEHPIEFQQFSQGRALLLGIAEDGIERDHVVSRGYHSVAVAEEDVARKLKGHWLPQIP